MFPELYKFLMCERYAGLVIFLYCDSSIGSIAFFYDIVLQGVFIHLGEQVLDMLLQGMGKGLALVAGLGKNAAEIISPQFTVSEVI